ncbi:PAS domain-containing protein [Sphingomonas lenta]|uniref:PAS domain-containing protein n=1 Tax=Sphingomonas lenta TaxID=1141887 RepID=A0A2A2SF78_9SPHN|nr:hypothetical protein [Sphingomonas lenta]PAX07850.1 hypothetical protein CKY28_09535 [Sphingomonas lenta]
MDLSHGLDAGADVEMETDESGVGEQMFDLGGDERRMHVRAYNHWVSLLKGQPFPAIADLDPAAIADFGDNSVLLDFTDGIEDPVISYLGRSLRDECGIVGNPLRVADVPSRSLLSRLTDHYLQIIANRAPIGFEAEFVNTRGHTTLYRGILMPYSSDGAAIDFIYGVINWKELADPVVQASLDAELAAAVRAAPAPTDAPVWADGPSHGFEDEEGETPATLDARLMMARESAAAVRAADTRSRAALYRALGRAHDFGLAAEEDRDAYARILAEAGIKEQARAPMTPVAKLVFGADYDKTRLTEFATVLGHARDRGVRAGELSECLSGFAGGIKAVVAEARAARAKPRAKPAPVLADRAPLARIDLQQTAEPGHVVVLVARVSAGGGLDVVGQLDDPKLTDRAVRALG